MNFIYNSYKKIKKVNSFKQKFKELRSGLR